jgi:ATP-dependent Clp protease ATP-binding subunit ClpX
MEGAELEFDEEALREIARLAQKRETGARGLRAIVEELMLDVMYDLPDMDRKGTHYVTAEIVRGERRLHETQPRRKSA